MHRYRASTLALTVLALLYLADATARALNPGKPPGGNFDLTHWYLGLPVDSSGGTNGDSASITTAQLTNGYTSAYFYTGTDGAMVFWAFVTGATTSGSSYPRSELRELISPPATQSNWFGYGTHVLDAQCKVLQVPSTKKVIIGQIHGFTGAALPLVKLQYSNGSLEGLIKTNSTDDTSDFKFTFGTVALSNMVTYQIKVVNGLVSLVMNGVTNSMNVFKTDPGWATNTLYFKAGDYCQDNSGPTNEGALISFYLLNRTHAPSITNQPASQTVLVGSNVTFGVIALGNAPVTYAWQLNGTNLAGRTNATLSIPNVQLTNAGTYSVIVSDLLGSVSSSNATLTVNTPVPTAPAAPSSLTPSPLSESQVQLSWSDNATNEAAYRVERSVNSNTWMILTSSLPPNSVGYTVATGNPSTLYYYRVNCTNAGGASAYAVASVTTPAGIGDGIPGSWRLQYFNDGLNTNGSSCATCDADGDGQNNLAEYLAGTDPTNSNSAFQILSIQLQGADIVIAWQTVAGKTNSLEAADSMTNFGDISGPILATGTQTNYVEVGGATNPPPRFYRVRLLP